MTPAEQHTAVLAALAELEHLTAEAAPAPWRWGDPGGRAKFALIGTHPSGDDDIIVTSGSPDVLPSTMNAKLIVALRNAAGDVLAGRRRILERHAPARAGSLWSSDPYCDYHYEAVGASVSAEWPCEDYRDAAVGLIDWAPAGT